MRNIHQSSLNCKTQTHKTDFNGNGVVLSRSMGSRGGYGSRRYVCVSGDGFGGWVKAATSKFGYCEFFGLHLIFVFEFSVFLSSSSVFWCS